METGAGGVATPWLRQSMSAGVGVVEDGLLCPLELEAEIASARGGGVKVLLNQVLDRPKMSSPYFKGDDERVCCERTDEDDKLSRRASIANTC